MYSRQHLILTALWLLTIALGIHGFSIIDPDRSFLSKLYSTLQLFGIQGNFEGEPPWSSNIARFLAPLLTIYTIVFALAENILIGARLLYARRFWKNHIIICGMGYKGFLIAENLIDEKYKVIVIDPDPEVGRVQSLRNRKGIYIIRGSGADKRLLMSAGIERASHVFITCGDSSTIASVWTTIRSLEGLTSKCTIHVEMDDPALAHRLDITDDTLQKKDTPKLRHLNAHSIIVRQLFAKYPLDAIARVHGGETPHLVLIGFGEVSQHILIESLQLYSSESEHPLRFTIIDPEATDRWAQFVAHYPATLELCTTRLLAADLCHGEAAFTLKDVIDGNGAVTAWYITLDDDNIALREALYFRQRTLATRSANAPVFVRLQNSAGFQTLLKTETCDRFLPTGGIKPFGSLDDALSVEILLNAKLDRLAEAFHNDYRRGEPVKASTAEWDVLAETYRRSNQRVADHLPVKMRAADIAVVEVGEIKHQREFALKPDDIEMIARGEHQRYVVERKFSGWRLANKRSDRARLHPELLPWEQLPEGSRAYNRGVTNKLTEIVKAGGKTLNRIVVIGVTGHRRYDNKPEVLARIRKELTLIQKTWPDHKMVVLSAMASGADQDVAACAVSEFGAELWVVLPLPEEIYLDDFEGDATGREQLVGGLVKAAYAFEMPMRFGDSTTLVTDKDARNRQYALVGAWIAQRSHHIIAVWDGKEAQGLGGTGDVVSWVQARTVPEDYRFPRLTTPSAALHIIPVTR